MRRIDKVSWPSLFNFSQTVMVTSSIDSTLWQFQYLRVIVAQKASNLSIMRKNIYEWTKSITADTHLAIAVSITRGERHTVVKKAIVHERLTSN